MEFRIRIQSDSALLDMQSLTFSWSSITRYAIAIRWSWTEKRFQQAWSHNSSTERNKDKRPSELATTALRAHFAQGRSFKYLPARVLKAANQT